MEWIYLISSIASSIAAVLAWAAKLWWGREFASAKDEIIKAKEAQIELLTNQVNSLKELTPMKIREYFLSVREQLEEYNNLLENKLKDAHHQLDMREIEIKALIAQGGEAIGEVEQLEEERQNLANAVKSLENELLKLQKKYESQNNVLATMPKIESEVYEDIDNSFRKLIEALEKDFAPEFVKLSKALLENSKITEQQQEIVKLFLDLRNSMSTSNQYLRSIGSKQEESNRGDLENFKSGETEDDQNAA